MECPVLLDQPPPCPGLELGTLSKDLQNLLQLQSIAPTLPCDAKDRAMGDLGSSRLALGVMP